MNPFDQTLLDPDADQLAAALRQAVDAVEHPGFTFENTNPLEQFADGLARVRHEAEGEQSWDMPASAQRPPGNQYRVRLAWWSDFLCRQHVRVTALNQDDGQKGPPLLRVYPDAGYAVSGDRGAGVLVVCACGVVGVPEEIAWMGTECGPCHDRRAAGVLPARPWDAPKREFLGGRGRLLRPVFAPDGTRLLVDDGKTEYEWELATGRQVPFHHPAGRILAWSADGTLLAAERDDRVQILWADNLQVERSFDISTETAWHVGFSPSGRYVFIAENDDSSLENALRVWDRLSPRSDPALEVEGLLLWALSPDERTLYLAEYVDDVRVFSLETTEELCPLTETNPDSAPTTDGLYLTPDGRGLIVNGEGLFCVYDLETEEILRERKLPAFARPGFPAPLLHSGRVLLATDYQRRTLNFVTLPDLTNAVTLTSLDGPNGSCCAWNDRWLAVADFNRARLVPWPPLLDWYLREIAR
jgi:hypothetical protein